MTTYNGCIQSVLFTSPYSGCGKFSGWQAKMFHKIPCGTSAPSPYNAASALMCVDRVSRHQGGPQTLQRTHFRPSNPYPMWRLGPTNQPWSGVKPMPPICRPIPPRPVYNLRAVSGPSTMGPLTIYAGWDEKGGDDWTTGSCGGTGHNLGPA